MKVLVTGGAGYIGSVASDSLLRAGHEVVVFDNLSHGHRKAVPPGAHFIEGDLIRLEAIRSVFERHKLDAVMHFAGDIQVGESMRDPLRYLGDNVACGLNLLRAVVDHGIRRFVFSSTANLYDRPERVPIDETCIPRPGSPYGEGKLYIERSLSWLDRTHGVRSASLRYFNAAGATAERGEDHDPESHLIPLVLQVASGRRDRISIFGEDYETPDGTCIRDYIHVSDLAEAHVLSLEALDRGSFMYNVGVGHGYSVKEVVETARRVTGHKIPVVAAPRRPGDVPSLVADSTRIRKDLGWSPRLPDLEQIVESAWRWHRDHPTGYGP
ncbi:MAG TPA: UDP-glucose 4-epimerase GalE [Planctomycetota bacterium]|nr:UDP-glucose 4-epimerase GalE [Planctomycetota bacterium]